MRHRYDRDLQIHQIAPAHRLATYRGDKESLILVAEEVGGVDSFCLVSFDNEGYCTNASEVQSRDLAWDRFYAMLCDIREDAA